MNEPFLLSAGFFWDIWLTVPSMFFFIEASAVVLTDKRVHVSKPRRRARRVNYGLLVSTMLPLFALWSLRALGASSVAASVSLAAVATAAAAALYKRTRRFP